MNQSVETIKGKEEEKKRGGERGREGGKKRKCMNRKKNIRGIELTTFTMSTLLYIHTAIKSSCQRM